MIKPNISEEEKKKILEELLKENSSQTVDVERNISYKNIIIEPGKKDKLLKYGDSLQELLDKNYERHLFPWESFGLIIDYLENNPNLTENLKVLAKNMLEGHSEWFNLFMKKEGDKLFCYIPKIQLAPEDVKWNPNTKKYEVNEKKLKIDKKFIIKDIPSKKYVDLEKFKKIKRFIEYFYTKEFDELPEPMKKGTRKAQIYLPPENVLWPVGRGDFHNGKFVVYCCYDDRASRGVAKNFSTQNKG